MRENPKNNMGHFSYNTFSLDLKNLKYGVQKVVEEWLENNGPSYMGSAMRQMSEDIKFR